MLRRVKPFLKTENLINIYRSIIEPYFTFCCIVWDSISETQTVNLQKLQNRAARIITGASYSQRSSDVLCELGWMTLETMRKRQKAILNGLAPPYLSEMTIHPSIHPSLPPSQARTNVNMMSTCSREVALFYFTKACSWRLHMAYFAEKKIYLKTDWALKMQVAQALVVKS